MDRGIIYIILALLAAFLFFFAVGYNGWGCGDSILGPNCIISTHLQTTGALLLTAGLLILLAGIFFILLVVIGDGWMEIAAAVISILAAIIAMAGVFYYMTYVNVTSPFIATIGMALTVAVAVMILFVHIGSY